MKNGNPNIRRRNGSRARRTCGHPLISQNLLSNSSKSTADPIADAAQNGTQWIVSVVAAWTVLE